MVNKSRVYFGNQRLNMLQMLLGLVLNLDDAGLLIQELLFLGCRNKVCAHSLLDLVQTGCRILIQGPSSDISLKLLDCFRQFPLMCCRSFQRLVRFHFDVELSDMLLRGQVAHDLVHTRHFILARTHLQPILQLLYIMTHQPSIGAQLLHPRLQVVYEGHSLQSVVIAL